MVKFNLYPFVFKVQFIEGTLILTVGIFNALIYPLPPLHLEGNFSRILQRRADVT
jgi:hypothetical protein